MGLDGRISDSYHDNLMLNSKIHGVEIPGGKGVAEQWADNVMYFDARQGINKGKEYSVNVISENMLTQVEFEGLP
eukprot:5203615-Ditylum_brightwellii.AAC.1